MKSTILIFLFTILFINILQAQTFDFGNVPVSEISETKDSFFSDSSAMIIYENINFEFGRIFEVHIRIKIYNKEGFKYADWEIPYNNVKSLKAATYNLENGVIIKSSVSKKGIFKEKITKDFKIRKISFPNVKEGSVLELKYKIKNVGLNTIFIQNILPIKKFKLEIKDPNKFGLKMMENPYVSLPIRRIEKRYKTIFIGENIPALKLEKFIGNINNHRGKIIIDIYGKNRKITWGDITNFYHRAKWFGGQLRKNNFFYNNDLKKLIKNEKDSLENAKRIFNYLKKSMHWNKYMSLGSDDIKKAYIDKKGNTADINLLLISMLRSIGFEANPMLIASKEQGWVLYPSYNAFDVVICALEINNKIYLLDASKKNGGFGEIPLEYNNGKGLIMFDDGYSLNFPTMIKEKSKNSVLVGTVIDVKNLKITGNIDKQITKYFAWEFRDLFENTKDEDYIDFLERNTLLKISNLEKTDFENFNKPIKISFNFEYEDYIEKIDDKLYFGPLLYFKKEENDFNEENRLYPIDLNFPYSEKFIINYNIPEGYKVESLPLNKRYIIADNIGELIFHIKASDKNIQVSLKVLINHAVIPAFYYKQLNILFNEYSIISKSKIVLSKI